MLVPAVSVDGVVRPISLGADAEQRLLTDLTPYQATVVQRLLNRQGAPSLAVRVTFSCEAESEWASKCLRSPTTQHACSGVPAAKNSITPQSFASKAYRSVHGAGGGVTENKGVVPLPLAQTARAHIAPPGWGAPSIALDFWQTKSQTYMPYNHAIRQAKQILHYNTTTNRPAHTTPQSSHAGQPQNQQQTATH